MGFVQDQIGLAEQVAKANAYDRMKAVADANAIANFYAQRGAQLGFQEGVKQAPVLYAQSELQRDAEFNRIHNGANYSTQPVVRPTNLGLSGKAWDVDSPKTLTETDLWLQRIREQKEKGQ